MDYYEQSLLTVLTPASDYNLVSLDAVKDELGVEDDSIDGRLNRWLREAKDAIEGVIGRVLRAEAVSEVFRSGVGAYACFAYDCGPAFEVVRGLTVSRYPILAVTQIIEDAIVLTPATDYEVDAAAGKIYRLSGGYRVPWGGQLIEVDYSGGYATADDVPGDIQAAVLTLLKHRRAGQTRDPMLKQLNIPGVIERQFWVGSTGDYPGLPPEVLGLILRYRDTHF